MPSKAIWRGLLPALLVLFGCSIGILYFSGGADAQPMGLPVKNVDVGDGKKEPGSNAVGPGDQGKGIEAETNANGNVKFEVNNKCSGSRNDLHFVLKEPAAGTIEVVGSEAPLSEADPAGPASSVGVKKPSSGGSSCAKNGTQEVHLKVWVAGQAWNGPIKVDVYWTDNGAATHCVDSGKIGDGTTLVSLDLEDFDPAPVEVNVGSDGFNAPTIALAEMYGFRFEQGELMVSLNADRGAMFFGLQNLVITAWDEEGTNVTEVEDIIQIGTPRIDSRGNLVIPIPFRNSSDDKHIVLLINGAYVTNTTYLSTGDSLYATFRCTALAGLEARNEQKLAEIVDP